VFYVKIYVHSLVDKLKRFYEMHGATIRFIIRNDLKH